MHLVIGRQMRLISRRQNVFGLEKLGGFAVVSCCVLMVFSGTLMEFGQRWHGGPFLVDFRSHQWWCSVHEESLFGGPRSFARH